MHPYERLIVWQRAHELAVAIHRVTMHWPDDGLRGQVRRSARSVAANIAEGSGALTAAQFARFLGIALASLHETDYHLRFAADVGVLSAADRQRFAVDLLEVKRMLLALHRAVRANAAAAGRPS